MSRSRVQVVVWVYVYDDGDSNAAVVGALLAQCVPYVSELRINGVLIHKDEENEENETPADDSAN